MVLACLEQALLELGASVTLGVAVAAAQQAANTYLQQQSKALVTV